MTQVGWWVSYVSGMITKEQRDVPSVVMYCIYVLMAGRQRMYSVTAALQSLYLGETLKEKITQTG